MHIEMDDNFHSAINHLYDEFIPKTVAQDADECPELSILFKVKRFEGGPLPPFLLTTEAVSTIYDEAEVLRPTNIRFFLTNMKQFLNFHWNLMPTELHDKSPED